MRSAPRNVRYADLARVCDQHFGTPRQQCTSHCVYAMPWSGDPRVNIQRGQARKAKVYQVKQVLAAIAKLEKE